MPAPAFPFNPLSDSELSIKKPITQSMMRRLRDDSWIKLPDAGVTEELDTSKSLKPDGAGGTMWGIGGMTASQDSSNNTGSDSSADVTLPGGTVSLINFTGVVGNGASTDSLVQGSIVVFPDGTFRGQWVDSKLQTTIPHISGQSQPHTTVATLRESQSQPSTGNTMKLLLLFASLTLLCSCGEERDKAVADSSATIYEAWQAHKAGVPDEFIDPVITNNSMAIIHAVGYGYTPGKKTK